MKAGRRWLLIAGSLGMAVCVAVGALTWRHVAISRRAIPARKLWEQLVAQIWKTVDLQRGHAAPSSTTLGNLLAMIHDPAKAAAKRRMALYPPLPEAIAAGNQQEALRLISKWGVNPNQPNVKGETPLYLAARAKQTDVCKALLAAGAQVDAGDVQMDITPLMAAGRAGQPETVKLLLGANANVTAKGHNGETPVEEAIAGGNAECVQLLLAAKAPVDVAGVSNLPLIQAVRGGNIAIVRALIEAGADVHALSWAGQAPLLIAVAAKRGDIAALLREHGARDEEITATLAPTKALANAMIYHLQAVHYAGVRWMQDEHMQATDVPTLDQLRKYLNADCPFVFRGGKDFLNNSVAIGSNRQGTHISPETYAAFSQALAAAGEAAPGWGEFAPSAIR